MNNPTPNAQGTYVPIIIPKGLIVLIGILLGLGFFFMPPQFLSLTHFVKTTAIYIFGIPALFMLASLIINRLFSNTIRMLNAATLGWVMSLMVIFWLMGK